MFLCGPDSTFLCGPLDFFVVNNKLKKNIKKEGLDLVMVWTESLLGPGAFFGSSLWLCKQNSIVDSIVWA